MALLYSGTKPNKTTANFTAHILDLDYQGLGVAKINGKTWFIENALPQESVEVRVLEEKRQYGHGTAQRILRPSPQRQTPPCTYFAQCGGCQNQHIPIELQRSAKQKALIQRLSRLQPEPIQFMPLLQGEPWHYRRRVRLSVGFNNKTRKLHIGLRRKNAQQIIPIEHCPVLEQPLNDLLPKLTALFAQWSAPQQLGHIELVAADNGIAMLLRHIKNVAENDRTLLLKFAERHRLMLFVQAQDAIEHWHGGQPFYRLDDDLTLQFDIRDFIQINAELNRQMINTALDWLALNERDHVLDLFCGMGNFTLPIARRAKSAVGIEGVSAMVEKARRNAERNCCHNVQFDQADLDKPFVNQGWAQQPFNKILLDPPRTGAAFALNALCQLQAENILYVSCNPATLVRDTEILRNAGYQLDKVAMIDMFPHTGHLESISLFREK
ncbi:23S rRNA (uracil(1939)-C(5))-methyltransferase RlmD [Aggregatibacter actinomycetemcomitans]|uniref:23S rRNA (uracil(1939)-C(5))-methyltransferase RlmD n=1 Tax=Aggregatibacter actinomycetemcomitans TaxID=714 RepID=UPI00197C3556|nr:23S rRNA (uracil(1939)-C(5))-methyltransferase RlmD [Aggregatibacter actinomycetemcomitans]MBN6074409.1 23S rRNA (uracil(1939)-C(5))-methyltransferase RlmD [Aggregatibacter actinomycetemcomitans]